jgi:diacylglycerol kinase (ATP)
LFKKILFIINPISGGKQKIKFPALVKACLDLKKFDPSFRFTENVGHASLIAQQAIDEKFDIVVAVGGDGTVNEVAAKLVNTDTLLGIVPLGSGNGLARSLQIPMDVKKAIRLINAQTTRRIDAAQLNGVFFFNMAGMGFDAHISAVFAGNKSRGLKSYVQMGLQEITSYRPQEYQITIDGTKIIRSAFMISVANSSQYGNNVHISPKSSLTDGLLDVCIVKPFPLYKLPLLAYQMLRATTHQSKMVEIIRGKNIHIARVGAGPIHLDGEPFEMDETIDIKVIPSSLQVIAN